MLRLCDIAHITKLVLVEGANLKKAISLLCVSRKSASNIQKQLNYVGVHSSAGLGPYK